MKTTMTLAANNNCSIFEIMEQDTDDVIVVINFYIALGAENPQPAQIKNKSKVKGKEERIRVNDKTASGGWW